MANIQLTPRDLYLFEYLHSSKVATFKQIRRDVFRVGLSTAWERLNKLMLHGWIACKGTDFKGDKSSIFALTSKGFKYVLKSEPHGHFWNRYKSNSIEHDLRLVDIKVKLQGMRLATHYWTENQLQTSAELAHDDTLLLFKMFNFDALIKLDNREGNHLLCGIEFESTTKNHAEYQKKLSLFYKHSFLKAVLYVCENEKVEKALKKAEQAIYVNGEKKLFYLQHSKLLSGEKSVTFKNQDNRIITIN